MAFQWQLLSETPAPPPGGEQWNFLSLPTPAGLVRYAVQLTMPTAPPSSWNTAGYFGIAQTVAGRLVVGRTNPLPLVWGGQFPLPRALGPGDFDVVAEGNQQLFLLYSLHRWIDADNIRLWGLIDV